MSVAELALIDPGRVLLVTSRSRRIIGTELYEETVAFDMDARKYIYIQQVLDQAFFINNNSLRSYMQQHLLAGDVISTRDLPIHNAKDFLAVANAIGLASTSSLSSDFEFVMNYEASPDTRVDSADEDKYFSKKDHFTVELINSGPQKQAGAQ